MSARQMTVIICLKSELNSVVGLCYGPPYSSVSNKPCDPHLDEGPAVEFYVFCNPDNAVLGLGGLNGQLTVCSANESGHLHCLRFVWQEKSFDDRPVKAVKQHSI